ncbi:MAG: hypothetical protein ACLUVV_01070 [Christensenellales bacterium]
MKQPMARVVSHEQIAHGIYELTLFTPIADIAEPGQFVHVKIPGGDATLLRRPISIARSEESTLTLIYQIKGKGTRLLSHVGAGDFLDVLASGRRIPYQTPPPWWWAAAWARRRWKICCCTTAISNLTPCLASEAKRLATGFGIFSIYLMISTY